MKNIFKNGKGFLRITFFCVITFGIGLYIGTNYNKPKAEAIVDTENSGFDLKLPGEVEKRTVTVDEVESRIFENYLLIVGNTRSQSQLMRLDILLMILQFLERRIPLLLVVQVM